MLFTSGTTGKPKGTVHTHAGCMAQMGKEIFYNFDLEDDDVFWWFSDIGWMMGPWEIIGCFQHGGTIVIFEGAPDYPQADRVWSSVEAHGVTTLGISPNRRADAHARWRRACGPPSDANIAYARQHRRAMGTRRATFGISRR